MIYLRLKWWTVVSAMPLMALITSGCVSNPPVRHSAEPIESVHQNVRMASRKAALEIASQIKATQQEKGAIWIAPAINRQSGEITASGREFQVLMAADIKSMHPDLIVHSLGGDPGYAWRWVVSPQVEFEKPQDGSITSNWFKVTVSTINTQGDFLPGAMLRINAQQFDATPSKFFKDAPIYLIGNYHTERTQLTVQPASASENSTLRRRFISIEAFNQQGILEFEDEKYHQSILSFQKSLELDRNNIPALFGVYQAWYALNERIQYEKAFSNLISAAVAQNNISFKFLFQVASAEFRNDIEVSKQYDFWLSHLSKQVQTSGRCLLIQGHASKTGSTEYNEQLSQNRAKQVAALMIRHVPELKAKISFEGRGFKDNLVGSGTDDAKDAVDRRVDFKLQPCS